MLLDFESHVITLLQSSTSVTIPYRGNRVDFRDLFTHFGMLLKIYTRVISGIFFSVSRYQSQFHLRLQLFKSLNLKLVLLRISRI